MKQKRAAFLSAFLAILLAFCSLPFFSFSKENTDSGPGLVYTAAAVACNATRGDTLYSLNPTLTMFPGGTVKVMTAALALEKFGGNSTEVFTFPESVVKEATGTTVDFKTGEEVPISELLGCLIVGNANDAALALAVAVSGSVDAFVAKMNAKAAELGMKNTHYTNPTGMHDEEMVTTAADTMLLACYAAQFADYFTYSEMAYYTVSATNKSKERILNARNYLVSTRIVSDYYDSTVTGMNYGFTYEAGGCLVASTIYKGETYLAVLLGSKNDVITVSEAYDTTDEEGKPLHVDAVTKTLQHGFEEASALLKWAKGRYSYVTVVSSSQAMCEISVSLGSGADSVPLFPADSVEIYLPTDADLSKVVRVEYILDDESLTAPVSVGQAVGTVLVYYQDELYEETDLITRNAVERNLLEVWLSETVHFLRQPSVIKWLFIAMIVLFLYVLGAAALRFRMKKESIARHRREREEAERAEMRKKLGEGQKPEEK